MDIQGLQFHLDWLVVGALLIFTALAGWSDLRTGRIPNILLQRLFWLAAVWFWLLAIVVGVFDLDATLIFPERTLPSYLLAVGKNVGIAFFIGVILWFARLWAAGDAKLFPLVVLLLPLRFYENDFVRLWPAFVLFYNFVMATVVVILGDLVLRGVGYIRERVASRGEVDDKSPAPSLWRRWGTYAKENAGDWGRFALMILLVFMFVKTLRHFMRDFIGVFLDLDPTLLYVVLFFACHPIIHFMHHKWALISAAAIVLTFVGVAVFTTWIPGLTFYSMIVVSGMALFLMVFRMVYDAYQERIDYVEIEVDDLRSKMILSDDIMRRLSVEKAYFRAQQIDLGPILPDGLTPDQVPIIQRWLRERQPGEPCHIQKTFPMGPSMFIGVIFTLIARDYILALPR